MIVLIGFIVTISIIAFVMISHKPFLHLVQYDQDEEILVECGDFTILSKGRGSRSTRFPRSRIVVTNKRIILAQKLLWQKKYQTHYFMWREFKQLGALGIRKGIVQFILNDKSCSIDSDGSLVIDPAESPFIKKLTIPNPPEELVRTLIDG